MSETARRHPTPSAEAVAALWQLGGLPGDALAHLEVAGNAPVLPSSFDVATAAQAGLAAAALAAAELWHLRTGRRQQVQVDRCHATLECSGWFALDGRVPAMWDKLSGLYACGEVAAAPGWVRIHANFAHHRDIALRLLDLPARPDTPREAVSQALRDWTAEAFEQAAADAGGVVAAARSFAQWDAHPQALALAGQPVLQISPIDGAPPAPAVTWPAIAAAQRPLTGLRVLDLTRILAGPVAGRCLAAYGADVLMVNGPHLPNIEAIADTSRGKRSALIDLRESAGRDQLDALVAQADVFLQGYRPGALAGRGYGAAALAARRPGIVVASLSAYGPDDASGPWAGRRGFDSLVQTATGFNLAEAEAAGKATPQALPMQILDYSAGHLLAFGIQAALWRRATQGGSWQVQVSLAGVGHWLRSLGRVRDGFAVQRPAIEPWLEDSRCGFGEGGQAVLRALRHAAQFSATPAGFDRPSMPPGSHPPSWTDPG
ncbi:MAG: CoA transferase [Burkholderiaceae bacterium]|nr:CoA transferase [Burkholderiaceae bacterium]